MLEGELWLASNSRFDSRLPQFLVNTGPASVHGPILGGHDCLKRPFILDISRKAWDLWDDNDHLEFGAVFVCHHNTFDNGVGK